MYTVQYVKLFVKSGGTYFKRKPPVDSNKMQLRPSFPLSCHTCCRWLLSQLEMKGKGGLFHVSTSNLKSKSYQGERT